MKKKVIAATLAAMMVASLTACGAPKQLSKSVTVELGNEKGINIADILDISKDKVKDAKLNTKKVDFFKTGEYDATITYDKKDYSVKVKIKDTTAPEAAKESIVVQPGAVLHVTDCLDKITELSGNVDAKFETKPEAKDSTESTEPLSDEDAAAIYEVSGVRLSDDDEITYTEAGDYDNNIIITDKSGNKTTVAVKISVINAPSINGVTDKTVTVGDSIDYMAGVTAADGKGEELTSSVEVDSSAVKTDTAGTYQATYKVTDKYGLTGNATSNVTVNEPAKEETVNNTDSGESSKNDSGKNNSGSSSKKKNKKNNSSGSTNSESTSSGTNSAGNTSGGSTSNGGSSSSSSNPKAGVTETLYDGSISNGITAEEKAHIDGIVSKWLSGGCSQDAAEDEAINYLGNRGYTINGSGGVKNTLIAIPNGVTYTIR